MQKILVLLALLALSTGLGAEPEMSRTALQQRVEQAFSVFRQGGAWKARVEDHRGGVFNLGNFYIEYPNRALLTFDISGRRNYYQGETAKQYLGSKLINEYKMVEDPLWFLFKGEIGANLEIDMLTEETINYFGKPIEVVVSDLKHTTAKGDTERLRVYVRKEGSPLILGCAVLQDQGFAEIWLRDFHPRPVPADLFKPPVL